MESKINELIEIHQVFTGLVDELLDLLLQVDDPILKLKIRVIIRKYLTQMSEILGQKS